MKTNDSNNTKKMVARQEPPQNTFKVTRNEEPQDSEADKISQEVSEEEAELLAVEEGLAQRKKDIADKKAKADTLARQEKLEKRASLLEDAADWREMAKTNPDPEKGRDYLRRAKEAERDASQLGVELNLNEPLPVIDDTHKPSKVLASGKAIQYIVGLFVFSVAVTYFFGAPLEADPMNAMGQSMMKNAPIRALLAFTLTFLTVLVAGFLIRICFPQFYRIWHNQIDSERSLEQLLQEAPAGYVLLALLGLVYTFMQLFASFYQALYA
jgi:hypothetical protein